MFNIYKGQTTTIYSLVVVIFLFNSPKTRLMSKGRCCMFYHIFKHFICTAPGQILNVYSNKNYIVM